MAGGPYRIAEGDDLTVDASASLAGSGATFSWDLDDDGAFDDATGATPTVTWAELMALGIDGDGSYPMSLQITDGPTTVSDDTTLTITETASTVSIEGPSNAVAGQPLTIKVGAVDPSPGDLIGTFTYTVDWGDGATPLTVDGPADPPVTHTYATAGRFTVTASFTAPDGVTSDPATFLVTITARATTSPGATGSTAPSATLPRTGGDTDVVVLVALAVLAAGALTVIASSRIRVRPGRR